MKKTVDYTGTVVKTYNKQGVWCPELSGLYMGGLPGVYASIEVDFSVRLPYSARRTNVDLSVYSLEIVRKNPYWLTGNDLKKVCELLKENKIRFVQEGRCLTVGIECFKKASELLAKQELCFSDIGCGMDFNYRGNVVIVNPTILSLLRP